MTNESFYRSSISSCRLSLIPLVSTFYVPESTSSRRRKAKCRCYFANFVHCFILPLIVSSTFAKPLCPFLLTRSFHRRACQIGTGNCISAFRKSLSASESEFRVLLLPLILRPPAVTEAVPKRLCQRTLLCRLC